MKVTFDSNVWRIISSPDKFPKESSIESFKRIGAVIKENKITPFLCETVFTLEAIKRKERKDFFSEYKAKIDSTVEDNGNGGIKLSLSIGPNLTAHPGNNEYLESHLNDAISLGFKIIKLPRVSGVVNPDIEKHFYSHKNLSAYHNEVFEIGRAIEVREAGMHHIKELGKKYADFWVTGIQKSPEHEKGNIAKAVAEWADGDSVACHIAVDGDYFCTRDVAKKAGDKSILSEDNIAWLKQNYNFTIISPEDLALKFEQ